MVFRGGCIVFCFKCIYVYTVDTFTSCTVVRNEIFLIAKCFKAPFFLQDFADEQKEKADAAFKDAEYRSHLSFCRWIVLEVEVFVSFMVILLSRYRRSQDVQVGKLVNA